MFTKQLAKFAIYNGRLSFQRQYNYLSAFHFSSQTTFKRQNAFNDSKKKSVGSHQMVKSTSKPEVKEEEGLKIKDVAQKEEFYGLPLKKMPPKSESDLLFKLNQQFTSGKELLNFFELNRDLFSQSPEAFSVIFKRLAYFDISDKKKQNEQGTSKGATPIKNRAVEIINEPQFKVLLDDYNRYLNQEIQKYRKFTQKEPLYDSFLASFESLMGLFRSRRFQDQQLPEYVRKCYFNMLNDENYLRTLTPSQISYLFNANASPNLLALSIKSITKFAHKLADILCESSKIQGQIEGYPTDVLASKDALQNLTAKDIFNIVYGFGQLHLVPHSELLFMLEPFILRQIPAFTQDQLNLLAGFYIRMQRGSEDFIKQLFAILSLNQDKASLSSQAHLLLMLDIKILNRSDFKIDFTKEVRLISKSIMTKLNQLHASSQLQKIVPRMLYFQIGIKAYYEMLAIEFVKHVDEFSLKNKARLLYWFALADIDSGYILKTAHKLCSAYVEAFLHRGNIMDAPVDLPKLGLYTEQQIKYITDASKEIDQLKQSIIKAEQGSITEKVKAEDKLKEYANQIAFEETYALMKFAWSYMVFSNSSKDKEFKTENKLLWEKISSLLTTKLNELSSKGEAFKALDLDYLHQINCFLFLEVGLPKNKLIKIPQHVKFEGMKLDISTPNKAAEYLHFVRTSVKFMKDFELKVPEASFYDFYRLYGGINLSETMSSKDQRPVYIVFNQKQWYFEDTNTYNSFTRIRREHLKKAAGASSIVEIDFYEVSLLIFQCLQYLDFKKSYEAQIKASIANIPTENKEEEEDDSLFTLNKKEDAKDMIEVDPVIAYLNTKMGKFIKVERSK